MCTARVLIQCITYVIQFVGLPSCSHEIILEWHFLSNHHAIINYPQAQIELLPLWEPQQNELSIKLMVADDTGIPPSCSVIEPVSCNVAADTTVVFTPSVFFCFAKVDFLNFRCPSISLWFKLEGDLQRVLLPDNTVPRGVSGIRGTGLFLACRARSRRTVLLPCEYT